MSNRTIFTILFLCIFLLQNMYAQSIKIVKINSTSKHIAKFVGIKNIYVKENRENLGEFTWSTKKKSYIDIIKRKKLFFKKGMTYLISEAKYNSPKLFTKYLKNIDNKRLSKQVLKDLFSTYSKLNLKQKNLLFYSKFIRTLAKKRLLYMKNREYFFLADKAEQIGYIFLFHTKNNSLEYIGGDKISTGNPLFNSRNDRYFDTPISIINRKRYHKGDWRSIGKRQFKYGKKSDRIFYLGKHLIPIKYKSHTKREIHLAIHSTTPIDEVFLGTKASKGCIRISGELNKILNLGRIIDGKYGKYVIIADSSLSIKENLKRLKIFPSKKVTRYAMAIRKHNSSKN